MKFLWTNRNHIDQKSYSITVFAHTHLVEISFKMPHFIGKTNKTEHTEDKKKMINHTTNCPAIGNDTEYFEYTIRRTTNCETDTQKWWMVLRLDRTLD